eukprot:1944310-Amphidinium_carterae.1
MIPPESEAVIEHALERDGLLDQLGLLVDFVEQVKPYLTYIPIVLLVEFFLGLIFHLFYCEAPYGDWLEADALAMICLCGGLFLTYINIGAVRTL